MWHVTGKKHLEVGSIPFVMALDEVLLLGDLGRPEYPPVDIWLEGSWVAGDPEVDVHS